MVEKLFKLFNLYIFLRGYCQGQSSGLELTLSIDTLRKKLDLFLIGYSNLTHDCFLVMPPRSHF